MDADTHQPRKYRIVIAEDYTIVREGLRSLLSSYPDFEVVGEAEDGRESIRCVEQLKPDIVLMDLSLPRTDGMTAIQEIKCRSPETKVLVLTVHKTEGYVRRALEAGADGYILKDANYFQLETAVRTVLSGNPYLSPGISDGIIKGYLMGVKSAAPETRLSTLTPRELEIFKLVAEGYKSKDIADYLFISVNTVDKHRANIMKKLNLHSISALTTLALKEGLVDK
jgi:DNA-binding NarL/FixJ family response regulator